MIFGVKMLGAKMAIAEDAFPLCAHRGFAAGFNVANPHRHGCHHHSL